jgi:hypothetical protein
VPCPGPLCPVVSSANYKGCFKDKQRGKGCDLPCNPPGSTGHCTQWGTSPCVSPGVQSGGSPWIPVGGVQNAQKAPDSVERCNQLCIATGVAFKYFGMQAGHACFCGMAFGTEGAAPDGQCDVKCPGNATQTCGGADVNSVWAVQPLARA